MRDVDAEAAITSTASDADTLMEMEEDLRSGPGTVVPRVLPAPIIKIRNTKTRRRLAFVTEQRETP